VASDAIGTSAEYLLESYASEEYSSIFYSSHSIIYTAVFLLFVAVPVVRNLLGGLVDRLMACISTVCCCCCASNDQLREKAKNEAFTSNFFYREISILALKEHYERASRELKEL
jgi:hypothetical protein